MTEENTFTSYFDPKFIALMAEIETMMRPLMLQKHQLKLAGITPTAVLLPSRFNTRYDGKDADPEFKGTMLGLPIEFSTDERWGLIVEVNHV